MIYKTKPFAHQYKAFEAGKDKPAFAYLMEQGTGKTKVTIDNAAYLFEQGGIDAMLVIAPNGVHRNWVDDELPTHMSDSANYKALIYRSGSVNTKRWKGDFEDLMEHQGLAVLAINIDAIITNNGKAILSRFLKERKVMGVIDESTDIKTPGAKRTKVARGMAKYMPYRRILTGTPTGNGNPLDMYSQFAFLDPDIIGQPNYTAFKHEYAIFESRPIPGQRFPIQVVKEFKNLDKLQKAIGPYSFRVTKDEALDLPPKLFVKRYFELSKEQRRIYNDLRTQFYAELASGEIVYAAQVLQRMTRQQQVACGYVGVEAGEPVRIIPGPNPRLEALKEVLEQYPGPTIIWCRFTKDIDLIMDLLGDKAVRYDGSVTNADRDEGKRRFMSGEAEYFVGNPKAGGRGLTLHRAKNVVYYSSYFGLEVRQQSEDRAHRIGLEHPVTYIDIVGEETVDEKVITALRSGMNIANMITGDTAKEWI